MIHPDSPPEEANQSGGGGRFAFFPESGSVPYRAKVPGPATEAAADGWAIDIGSRPMRLPAFLALLLLAACASTPREQSSSSAARIDPVRMSNMIRTLASDEYEGRAPGTAGEAKTIAYIAEQFRLAGLEPAGENGGWMQ
jgi:hypothetical protein